MQNLIALTLPAADLAAADEAIATLKRVFAPLVTLQPQQRRELMKMGDKSEVFARQAIGLLVAHPQIVPPNPDLAEAQADLAALDALRPRLRELRTLVEKADDTEMALGSDLMGVALEGDGLLKVSGKDEGLRHARRELSARWAKAARAEREVPAS